MTWQDFAPVVGSVVGAAAGSFVAARRVAGGRIADAMRVVVREELAPHLEALSRLRGEMDAVWSFLGLRRRHEDGTGTDGPNGRQR